MSCVNTKSTIYGLIKQIDNDNLALRVENAIRDVIDKDSRANKARSYFLERVTSYLKIGLERLSKLGIDIFYLDLPKNHGTFVHTYDSRQKTIITIEEYSNFLTIEDDSKIEDTVDQLANSAATCYLSAIMTLAYKDGFNPYKDIVKINSLGVSEDRSNLTFILVDHLPSIADPLAPVKTSVAFRFSFGGLKLKNVKG